jgi:phospholipase C
VFVDPNPAEGRDARGNDDHPPLDIRNGQKFVRDVYEALRSLPSPQRERTLLVICYDEHGGFYDHVPPPRIRGGDRENADPDPTVRTKWTNYGPRVPCLLVSAFVEAGTVVNDEALAFDHNSVHATIHRRFLTGVPMLSGRARAAHSFGRMLTRTTARPGAWTPMPVSSAYSATSASMQNLHSDNESDDGEDGEHRLRRLYDRVAQRFEHQGGRER